MTVDDIRKLSPEQITRMAEIRAAIEELESELEQLIKGEKPKRKPKKKPARKRPAKAASSTSRPAPAPVVSETQVPEPAPQPELEAEPETAPLENPIGIGEPVGSAFADPFDEPEMEDAPELHQLEPEVDPMRHLPEMGHFQQPMSHEQPEASESESYLTRLPLPKQGDALGAELDS